MKFQVNQIVKGKVTGHFIVLGYRDICGKQFVQVKPYCNVNKIALRGELALEEAALTEVVS